MRRVCSAHRITRQLVGHASLHNLCCKPVAKIFTYVGISVVTSYNVMPSTLEAIAWLPNKQPCNVRLWRPYLDERTIIRIEQWVNGSSRQLD